MKFDDMLAYALKNLRTRSLRSWLTIIGIVIGVLTIIAVTSIGDGLKKEVTAQLDMFGPDMMFIIPVNIEKSMAAGGAGGMTSGKLFEKDLDRVMRIPGVKSAAKMTYGRVSLQFKDKQIGSVVYAATANMFDQWGSMYNLEGGRFFKDSETKVAVLGNDAANQLFGKNKVSVGSIILINGENYRVVGILKKIGTSLSQHDDQSIFVPFDDGKNLFGNQLAKNEISFISIKVDEGQNAEEIKQKIEVELASLHRVTLDNKDFTVITADFINSTVGAVLGSVSVFLLAITLVSAVVGGIGIANTMFMSVIERTKEIGVLKSVGASRSDIQEIFLVESAIIGFAGGVLGLVAGLLVLFIAMQFGVPVLVRPENAVLAIAFSILVGVVSGWYPARQAAEMDAVEALGFE
jgi:putative ABC transport system permease protein